MQTLKTKSLTWHHLKRPSPADLKWLKEEFRIHSLVLDEISTPTIRPKVEHYDGYLHLVLHFPIYNEAERKTYAREVDFLLTKKQLVSVTYEPIPQLENFFLTCSTEKSYEELYASKTPAHLLFYIIKDLYAFALRELDHIQQNIDRIEEKVFGDGERDVLEELSILRRDIIDFRRSLKPQQVTLESLASQGGAFFGHELTPFLDSLLSEYSKVWNLLENNKEALDALYDNNVTVLSIKQNEAMRIVAIIAFITFPLMLFAMLFSMRTVSTPVIGQRYDFWIILTVMILATAAMFAFFRNKKWL